MKKTIMVLSVSFLLNLLVTSPAFAAADAFKPKQVPDVCLPASIEREEIGGTRWPIKAKYKHLFWLGQLFTMDDCGEMRLGETYGGEDSSYTLGSTIFLKKEPNTYFRRVLKAAGYEFKESSPDGTSSYVQEDNEISIYRLLLLKPYYKKIKSDDCVYCG